MRHLRTAVSFLPVLICLAATASGQGWTSRYNGPSNGDDYANALALDSAGNVYVTGYSDQGAATGCNYVTIKYDTNGNQKWLQSYDGGSDDSYSEGDYASGIAVDSAGNVYVTGHSNNDREDAYIYDFEYTFGRLPIPCLTSAPTLKRWYAPTL